MQVEGSVYPQEREYLKGKILVNFNVEEFVKDEQTMYRYEQLRLNPPMDEEAIAKEVAKHKEELKVKVITPLQAKLQLHAMGLLDEVEAMVIADRSVQLYWEYALEIQREHPTLMAMATQLGLTSEQLDEMFMEASKLQ